MAQITERKSVKMNCVDVEQVNLELCLDPVEAPETIKLKQVENKPVVKRLSKLFKKAGLKVKYPERIIPIHRLERQRVYRDYRVF